jgi:PKD repeat protein
MNENSRFFTLLAIVIVFTMLLVSFSEVPLNEMENDNDKLITGTFDGQMPKVPEKTGTRTGSPRTVLVELFTNWACFPHCPYANAAMNELADVYEPSDMVMIAYHTNFSTSDPFYAHNPGDVEARHTYYGGGGVPTIYFDGPPSYNHFWDNTYDTYTTFINDELAIQSPLSILLDGDVNPISGNVDVKIEITDDLPVGGDLKIRFAIVEDNKYAAGPNLETRHRYAMREMLSEESLPNLAIGETYEVSRAFGVHPLWDLNSISIIAFVQNDVDKDILQASVYDYIPQKILVVDDDESTSPHGLEDDYFELLSLMEYPFDGWMRKDRGAPTAMDLQNYEVVIWLTGNTTSGTLTAADQTALISYFDDTRSGLFLIGEDVGADIGALPFFYNYLHALYNSDTFGDTDITGVGSDPISDPFFLVDLPITGSSPSRIDPWTNATTTFFYSPSYETAAIRADHDFDSRLVYFPFMYFGGPDSSINKMEIMERVLDWLVVKVDYVQIRDSPGDSGNVITNLDLDVMKSKTLYCAAYNHSYGFFNNYAQTTFRETSKGTLLTITTPGASTTIDAGLVGGTATLTANYFGVTNTTTITVRDPTPDYIKLTDSPNGAEIPNFSMLANEEVTIYASSYNNTSDYLGLVDVDWSESLGLGSLDNSSGTSTTFQAGITGGVTTITGDYTAKGFTDSVDIDVIEAVIDTVEIWDAPDEGGSALTEVYLDVGQSMEFWCAAYNDSAGYLGDTSLAVWNEDSGSSLITLSGSGEPITVNALLAGGSAILEVDVNSVLDSITVYVNTPTVDYIQINYQDGASGVSVVDPTYPVGEERMYFGSTYNVTANYLGPVPVDSVWTSNNINLVSPTSPGPSSTITISDKLHGDTALTLNDLDGHTYQTQITVIEPTVDIIRFRTEPNQEGDLITQPIYDVGDIQTYYAACYNLTASYLGDLTVDWGISNPSAVNITDAGNNAQFRAIDIGSCDVTATFAGTEHTITITVLDITLPIAKAGAGGTINEGETFNFDASASTDNGRIVDYHWDFGDNTESNSSVPTADHLYDHPGIYDVTLTVTDAGGNIATRSIRITVLDITSPTAVATLPSNAQEDVPYLFDGGSSSDNVAIITYRWEFGDGEFYEGQYENITHIYENPGTYTVNLTVWDAVGYSHSTSSQLTVLDTTAPPRPEGLKVEPLDDGETLVVSWEHVSVSDLHHYELYVSINNQGFNKLTDLSKGITAYNNQGLTMGTSYKYYVVAVDSATNPSADSPIVEGYPDEDTDSDGVFNLQDEDDDNDLIFDFKELEMGTNPLDSDTDGDTHIDGEDAFPTDKKEWKDTDHDGIGDSEDAFPLDPKEFEDSDGDGIGDDSDFLPIHNMLFYLIFIVVLIVVIVVTNKIAKRKKAPASFEGPQETAPVDDDSTTPPSEPEQ